MCKMNVHRRGLPPRLVVATFALVFGLFFVSSCNVTRVVTTTSQYSQRGDTTVIIQSKTVESYDGKKL